MEKLNLYTAWIGMFMGVLAGLVSGLFFHKKNWLGGYSSWSRRMVRLGHISLFGIAFINFAFVFTVYYLNISNGIYIPSRLFVLGAVTMPLVCFLSAYKEFFRYFFFIPVLSVLLAMIFFIIRGLSL